MNSPINIQHPNKGLGLSPLGMQGRVESLNGPCKQLTIYVFRQRISGFNSLLARYRFDQHLPTYCQSAMTQPVGNLRPLNSQELGEDSQRTIVRLGKDSKQCRLRNRMIEEMED